MLQITNILIKGDKRDKQDN